MGFAQAGVVAGEGKAVTSDRPRAGEKKGCDAPGSIDPAAGENGCWGAERRSVQRSRLRCSVPGMPVVGKAANRITWNHFFCGTPVGGITPVWVAHAPQVVPKHLYCSFTASKAAREGHGLCNCGTIDSETRCLLTQCPSCRAVPEGEPKRAASFGSRIASKGKG